MASTVRKTVQGLFQLKPRAAKFGSRTQYELFLEARRRNGLIYCTEWKQGAPLNSRRCLAVRWCGYGRKLDKKDKGSFEAGVVTGTEMKKILAGLGVHSFDVVNICGRGPVIFGMLQAFMRGAGSSPPFYLRRILKAAHNGPKLERRHRFKRNK